MNKMLVLLEQLNILDKAYHLKKAIIEKVIVSNDSMFDFYISSFEMIPLDEIKLLLEAKQLFPYPANFCFNYQKYNEKDIIDYTIHIFSNNSEVSSLISLIDDKHLVYKDHTLNIECINDIQIKQIKSFINKLITEFTTLGVKNIQIIPFINEDNNKDSYGSIRISQISHRLLVSRRLAQPLWQIVCQCLLTLNIGSLDD